MPLPVSVYQLYMSCSNLFMIENNKTNNRCFVIQFVSFTSQKIISRNIECKYQNKCSNSSTSSTWCKSHPSSIYDVNESFASDLSQNHIIHVSNQMICVIKFNFRNMATISQHRDVTIHANERNIHEIIVNFLTVKKKMTGICFKPNTSSTISRYDYVQPPQLLIDSVFMCI